MENLKFVNLLLLLPKIQMEQFAAYAMYELKKTKEKQLLDYLVMRIAKGKALNKKELLAILELKEGEERKLTRVFSRFTEILEGFIAAKELTKKDRKDSQLIQHYLLLKKLKGTGQEQLFLQTYRKAERYISTINKNDTRQQIFSLALAHEVYFHPHVDLAPPSSHKSTLRLNHIGDLMDLLERVHSINTLQYAAVILSRKQIFDAGVPIQLKEEIERLKYPSDEHYLTMVYSEIITLYYDFEEGLYFALKSLILQNLLQLPFHEQDILFRHLINLTAHAIRLNKTFLNDALEIYDFGIENEFFLKDGYLVKEHLINYINVACELGKTDEAKVFLAKNKSKLPPSIQDQVVTLCSSSILIAEKDYQAAFILLLYINFIDVELRITGRSNRIRACYAWHMTTKEDMVVGEKKDVFIKDELDSFRNVLNRLGNNKKISKERLEANHCFRKIVLEMVNHIGTLDKSSVKKSLRKKLQNQKKVACRAWLLEQIDKM